MEVECEDYTDDEESLIMVCEESGNVHIASSDEYVRIVVKQTDLEAILRHIKANKARFANELKNKSLR